MPVIQKNGKNFVVKEEIRTPEQMIERLRLFQHHDAADMMEELLEYKWKYEELCK